MDCAQVLHTIMDNMEKAVVGKREVIQLALTALLSDGHLLLEDVPGVGKTTLARSLAQSVACSFARIQFTPDTLPGDVTGMSVYNMATGEFSYVPGAVMHEIVLADEINRTSPKTQASLLEAMEERQVTVDGQTYPLPALFMVIATQNPVEQLGTYRLPEAQLDRFMMRLSLGYPETTAQETEVIEKSLTGQTVGALRAVTTTEEICLIKTQLAQVSVHSDIVRYAVEIARQTRESKHLTLGASPRAAIALVKAARAWAYLQGRRYTVPEDIVKLCPHVLLHRLILSPEARLEGKKEQEVLRDAIRRCAVPVL